MTSIGLETTSWQRSSYSTSQENCVEVARTARGTAIRDSKDPDGPALVFGAKAFARFVGELGGQR